MSSLPLVRTIVLRASNVMALIVLALSAYTLSVTTSVVSNLYFTYSALAIATAVIHLCSVIPMNVICLLRDDAFTSKLAFEVGWLSFLWVMWLATGAQTAATLGAVVHCLDAFCGATQAIAAFGFLLWALLLGYVIALLCFAIRAAQAGQNIWMTDVKHVRWLEGTVNYEKPNLTSPNPNVATYPPGSYPGSMASPVSPHPQQYSLSGHPGNAPPQPHPYPQQGGGYQA
ncbi:hypothetical protein BJ322DRAFT_1087588 [Thelephora terrestris]|uniref:MARVEL domain-containing protein n=1 Tax=Thelephora terrestris TaxID=56493 RepID=A0A9P6H6B4_9AGAM|nr:hypothetical protein BJ322DRAFT_1087588 [Thelephora terrestris]